MDINKEKLIKYLDDKLKTINKEMNNLRIYDKDSYRDYRTYLDLINETKIIKKLKVKIQDGEFDNNGNI